MKEFVSWEYLSTVAGAAFLVAWIVQFFKPRLTLDPKLIAYVAGIIVLNATALALGNWTVQFLGLSFANAIVVALAATGEYEALRSLGQSRGLPIVASRSEQVERRAV